MGASNSISTSESRDKIKDDINILLLEWENSKWIREYVLPKWKIEANEIAKDIVDVDQTSNKMSKNSLQIKSSVDELNQLSEGLKAAVDQFKLWFSHYEMGKFILKLQGYR